MNGADTLKLIQIRTKPQTMCQKIVQELQTPQVLKLKQQQNLDFLIKKTKDNQLETEETRS